MLHDPKLIATVQQLMPATQGDASAGAFVGALAGTLIGALAAQNGAQPATNEQLLLLQQQNMLLQQQNAILLDALQRARPAPAGSELAIKIKR